MGTIVLLTAVAVEVAFAVFCVITKSNQPRARSIIRIAAFTIFLLLGVLHIVDWSFRYYGLAALLLILAVTEAVHLSGRKEENDRTKHSVLFGKR